MSATRATVHNASRMPPFAIAPAMISPDASAVLIASPITDLRSSASSRLASRNSAMCATRTTTNATAKVSASSPNASGTASAATRNAAIAANITSRTAPSSGSSTLVNQAYPTHAHQSTPSTNIAWPTPAQLGRSTITAVHWVSASTKTRSKNSSSGVTCSPSRRTARIRDGPPWFSAIARHSRTGPGGRAAGRRSSGSRPSSRWAAPSPTETRWSATTSPTSGMPTTAAVRPARASSRRAARTSDRCSCRRSRRSTASRARSGR